MPTHRMHAPTVTISVNEAYQNTITTLLAAITNRAKSGDASEIEHLANGVGMLQQSQLLWAQLHAVPDGVTVELVPSDQLPN
ncbi:MAG: hypothetical protein AAFP15_18565 [Bacteroidota bacterium]